MAPFSQMLVPPQNPVWFSWGFRYYDDAAINRVRFIKGASAQFSVDQVMGLIVLNQTNDCKQTHDAALVKLKKVEARINDLNRIRKTLKELIKQGEVGASEVSCPIIESLGHT